MGPRRRRQRCGRGPQRHPGAGSDRRGAAASRLPGAPDRPGVALSEWRPLRIAAHNGAPVWGGAEIAVCRLLAGLEDRGHRTLLYYNREEVGEPARETYGLETRQLHLGGDLALHHALRFARALRTFEPDALIVGTFRKLLLAALGGRMAGVPRVVARIGLSTDTPRNLKYRLVFRRWVDWIVVNDDELRTAYRHTLPDVPDDRLVTIHKGFRPPEPARSPGALREEVGVPQSAPVVGSVARLARQKRLDRLVRVMARLPPETHCLVAGEGPERESLEALARTEGVADRFHLLGFRDDVGDVLAALDVLVLPSERESLANAMLEALAAGVPVVSTPVSGAAEALDPLPDGRRPGLVVEADPDALARAVGVLLERPDERARMAEAARERARRRFSRERMLDRWEGVLRGDGPG